MISLSNVVKLICGLGFTTKYAILGDYIYLINLIKHICLALLTISSLVSSSPFIYVLKPNYFHQRIHNSQYFSTSLTHYIEVFYCLWGNTTISTNIDKTLT